MKPSPSVSYVANTLRRWSATAPLQSLVAAFHASGDGCVLLDPGDPAAAKLTRPTSLVGVSIPDAVGVMKPLDTPWEADQATILTRDGAMFPRALRSDRPLPCRGAPWPLRPPPAPAPAPASDPVPDTVTPPPAPLPSFACPPPPVAPAPLSALLVSKPLSRPGCGDSPSKEDCGDTTAPKCVLVITPAAVILPPYSPPSSAVAAAEAASDAGAAARVPPPLSFGAAASPFCAGDGCCARSLATAPAACPCRVAAACVGDRARRVGRRVHRRTPRYSSGRRSP